MTSALNLAFKDSVFSKYEKVFEIILFCPRPESPKSEGLIALFGEEVREMGLKTYL